MLLGHAAAFTTTGSQLVRSAPPCVAATTHARRLSGAAAASGSQRPSILLRSPCISAHIRATEVDAFRENERIALGHFGGKVGRRARERCGRSRAGREEPADGSYADSAGFVPGTDFGRRE